jgi:hypothetical protein
MITNLKGGSGEFLFIHFDTLLAIQTNQSQHFFPSEPHANASTKPSPHLAYPLFLDLGPSVLPFLFHHSAFIFQRKWTHCRDN